MQSAASAELVSESVSEYLQALPDDQWLVTSRELLDHLMGVLPVRVYCTERTLARELASLLGPSKSRVNPATGKYSRSWLIEP